MSRRTFVASGALGTALSLLGCGSDDTDRPGSAAPRPPEPATPPPHPHEPEPSLAGGDAPSTAQPPETVPVRDGLPPALAAWLTTRAVLSQRPHATALRTWTTEEQGREVSNGRVLTRSHTADLSQSFFDQLMSRRRATDPVAELLTSRPFHRSRYAWPHAWATAHGLHGSSYGRVLVSLHFREDALWLGYSTAAPETWTLHDAAGSALRGVDPRDVKSRIAGVFFEASPLSAPAFRARNTELPGWGAWGMREYVVRNPDCFINVSVDDAHERQQHERDLTQLAALGAWAAEREDTGLPPHYGERAARTWQTSPQADEGWRDRFARTLAIATPTYAPTAAALAALATPPTSAAPTRRATRRPRARPRPAHRMPDWEII